MLIQSIIFTRPMIPGQENEPFSSVGNSSRQVNSYRFGNPAGCPNSAPDAQSMAARLAAVQQDLGDTMSLAEARQIYIWNGPQGTLMNIHADDFVAEFKIDSFQPPYTYKADQAAAIFLSHGFVVWFRSYGGSFRLLAIPLSAGVYASAWGPYVRAYWQPDGLPEDETVIPMMKKLPCHWMIDQGYVTEADLEGMFNLDWHMPDYLTPGRRYLASTCEEASRISQEQIGFWDAWSVCGPLVWRILKDANSFPYRVGSSYSSPSLFIQANPLWNGRPWIGFDPGTYDLIHVDQPLAGYDFSANGDLYAGDIVYSYSTLYKMNDGRFDHIFLVAGIREDGSRVSVTNMVQNVPGPDCFIREVSLYTPGDLTGGVINYEWDGHGFGSTGTAGFDIFRWKWITYHLEEKPVQYTVRWGDTVETIAFDWKIAPRRILEENDLQPGVQFVPGQVITLPAPGS